MIPKRYNWREAGDSVWRRISKGDACLSEELRDKYMLEAIEEAEKTNNYLKVGAVIVQNNKIVSRGHNIIERGINHKIAVNKEISAVNIAIGNNEFSHSHASLITTICPQYVSRYENEENDIRRIINSGIKEVYIGLIDNNKNFAGLQSIEMLIHHDIKIFPAYQTYERELLKLLHE